jgi:two-component system sensor histidine kinase VanS
LQPISEAAEVIISLVPYLLIPDLLIALIAAYFYSRRLTKPILRLSDAASQMRGMTPGVASALNSRDELGELSKNLDTL